MQNWQRFEKLVQHIQAELSPSAQVTHDEWLVGRSGTSHQCDVVVRAPIGQLTFTCIFECKDLSERVDLDCVRSFVARLQDLGVSQGVLVTTVGYTRDAQKFARFHGLLMYVLFDAEQARWRDQPIVPVLVVRVKIQSGTTFLLDSASREELRIATEPPEKTLNLELYDTVTREWPTLWHLMARMWDAVFRDKQIVPKPSDFFESPPNRYQWSGRYVTVRVAFDPHLSYAFNHVSIATGRGFRNEETRQLYLGKFQSQLVPRHEAVSQWPEIADPADLACAPELVLYAVQALAYNPNAPSHIVFGRK